jgi:cytochrome c peroxidase
MFGSAAAAPRRTLSARSSEDRIMNATSLRHATLVIACAMTLGAPAHAGTPAALPNLLPFANDTGLAATWSTAGTIDLDNPFFRSFGTNGRSCSSCHVPDAAWSITPRRVRARFEASAGTDPLFRPVDGATSPLADVSTLEARREAYAMLLSKGLIRVGIGVPANAEFELVGVDDPYGFASAAQLSLFRRPLPAANLTFLSTVMWDGRETHADATSTQCVLGTTSCFASLHFDLAQQANDATLGHAQALSGLPDADLQAIVAFESGLYTAQIYDDDAGLLLARHGGGGPYALAQQPFHFGVNDVIGGDYVTGAPFDPAVFRLYDAWDSPEKNGMRHGDSRSTTEARRAVARGEALFNGRTFHITGVGGFNDDLHIPDATGTCSTCHDAPGAGSHSIPMPLDIGTADATRRTPDLPLYTLRNKATGATVQTTDPGRALVSGKWRDIGRFKGPVLRSLAARPPYFHNGSAGSLGAVVDFYDQRFHIGFTAQEKQDLAAFLRAL